MSWADVKPSVPGPMLSHPGPSRCRLGKCETSGPGAMSSRVDVESSGPRLILGCSGQCQVELMSSHPVRIDFGLFGPMSSEAGLGRCCVDWALTDV